MIYDVETVLTRTADFYKALLNAEIDCINTEKNDSIVLENIDSDCYVFETLTEDILNYDAPFVMYGLVPTQPKEVQENNFVKEIKMTFRVAFSDEGNAERNDEFYKLLRYQRALEAVIMKNTDIYQGYGKPMVTSLTPEAFEFNSKVFLNLGIDISVSITAR